MTNITVYDIEAQELERVSDANEVSVAEIIEQLIEFLPEVKEYNGWR